MPVFLLLKLNGVFEMKYVFICFSSYCLQNIKGILMASNEGRLIAAALEKEKSITIKQRRAMVRILVAFLIETFGEMWVTKDLF